MSLNALSFLSPRLAVCCANESVEHSASVPRWQPSWILLQHEKKARRREWSGLWEWSGLCRPNPSPQIHFSWGITIKLRRSDRRGFKNTGEKFKQNQLLETQPNVTLRWPNKLVIRRLVKSITNLFSIFSCHWNVTQRCNFLNMPYSISYSLSICYH